ncbi:hypothetical protein GBA63_14680 [Rubrobacter tropicus]|uniref:Uncharacterized protein n=1 Tax=Rubrobacter tropicus TaxID=2653851 RepID=A0A6G8QB96_9ACTN|nr:hypothetical protein [Rubrobacter tropicus]QIN83739.1 hypothetical protein GBA63_14680 [Rubrobacter tropicus]
MGVSTAGIVVVRTGLIPSEITTLGIRFAQADRASLLTVLALVVLYFLAAFGVYAFSDFLAWRSAFAEDLRRKNRERLQARRDKMEEDLRRIDADLPPIYFDPQEGPAIKRGDGTLKGDLEAQLEYMLRFSEEDLERMLAIKYRVAFAMVGPASVVRAAFEFLLPALVALYAFSVLWF